MPRKDLTDTYTVSDQIDVDDVSTLPESGFDTVICNRPDNEEPCQPSADEIAAACKQAGLAFHHLPFQGSGLTHELVAEFRDVIDNADGRVFAYCRSGQRSEFIWQHARQLPPVS